MLPLISILLVTLSLLSSPLPQLFILIRTCYNQLTQCFVCVCPLWCDMMWRIRFQHELKIISQQYPFEPIKYLRPSLRITFQEGIAMLRVSKSEREREWEEVREGGRESESACACILLLCSKLSRITLHSIISTSSCYILSCSVISCLILSWGVIYSGSFYPWCCKLYSVL